MTHEPTISKLAERGHLVCPVAKVVGWIDTATGEEVSAEFDEKPEEWSDEAIEDPFSQEVEF